MHPRELLRPLPLFFAFLFATVAVIDLVGTLTEEPRPIAPFLQPGAVSFQPLEPVIDFAAAPRDTGIVRLPVVRFYGDHWSEPEARGVWVMGSGAELEVDLPRGGQRLLVLDGKAVSAKSGERRLLISINGTSCGSIACVSGRHQYRVEVPESVLTPGSNRIVFEFSGRGRKAPPRRTLFLRSLSLYNDVNIDVGADGRRNPVTLDFEEQTITIRSSGVVEVPFSVDERVDALKMRYRFRSSDGEARIVVSRPRGSDAGRDAEIERFLDAEADPSGRLRIPLHGRRGGFVFRVHAEIGPEPARLTISSLELIEEGDPTRRPWADDRRRDR
jgi:hypothetical protein